GGRRAGSAPGVGGGCFPTLPPGARVGSPAQHRGGGGGSALGREKGRAKIIGTLAFRRRGAAAAPRVLPIPTRHLAMSAVFFTVLGLPDRLHAVAEGRADHCAFLSADERAGDGADHRSLRAAAAVTPVVSPPAPGRRQQRAAQ